MRRSICCIAALAVLAACGSAGAPSVDARLYGTWLWNGSAWKELGQSTEDLGTTFTGESLFYWKDAGGLIDMDGTSWDGSEWVSNPVGLPSPPVVAQGTVSIVDEADDQLLFADSRTKTLSINSAGRWTTVVSATSWPRARYVYGSAYDPVGGDVVLVMCCDPQESGMETWQWKKGAFTELAPFPIRLTALDLVPDGTGRLFAFSDKTTFVLEAGTWNAKPGAVSPPSPEKALLYDPASAAVFAIDNDLTVRALEPVKGKWTIRQSTTTPPTGCGVSNAVYDPELAGIVVTSLRAKCAQVGALP